MGLDNDDIKALIAILQKGLSDNDTDEDQSISQPAKRTPKPRATVSKPKVKKSNNKFDKMAEFNMCKEDVEIDRKIRKPPPSARNRPFDFVKVQCRVCGKKDKIAPSLIESTDRYKCNKCSTGAG